MARGFSQAPGSSPDVAEARKPELHKTHLMALGQSKNAAVREVIAERADCPLGMMVSLAHDRQVEVREAVARNPLITRSVMDHLAEDKHGTVVIELLTNPALPADLLDKLAFHKRHEVRDAAAARLDALSDAPEGMAEDSATPELRDRGFDNQVRLHVPVVGARYGTPEQQRAQQAGIVPVAAPAQDVAPAAVQHSPVATAPAPAAPAFTQTPVAFSPTGEPVMTAPAAAPVLAVPEEVVPERHAPTRTAPVRGFRPPS